jgi:hypothetical protein
MLQPNEHETNPYWDHDEGLTGSFHVVPDRRVELITRLIVNAEIRERVEEWEAGARKSPAGRVAGLSLFAVMVTFLILAVEGSPLLLTRGADLLFRRLTPKSRALLDIPDGLTRTQLYHMLQKGLDRLIALADPKPAKYHKRMTRAERKAMQAARDKDLSSVMAVRLNWLCNQILYSTVAAYPQMLDGWDGNVTIDATAYPVYSKHGQTDESLYSSIEPDAAFYMRDSRHKDTKDPNAARKVMFGYELHLVAPAANHLEKTAGRKFLQPVIGISQCPPSETPAAHGMTAITCAFERFSDYMRGAIVIGDRGYFANSKVEDLALPVRALGMGIMTDYKIEQTGVKDGYAGSELVEGHFYCPAMPQALKDAAKDWRNHRVDPVTFLKRIDAREPYLLRRKAKPDADGYTPMMCPASGPNATVICPLKPRDASRNATKSLMRIVPTNLPSHPDRICSQTSVVFPPTAGAKFRQDIRYLTRQWFRLYRSGRNFIESTNAYIKDDSSFALRSPGRRRVHGHSKQYFLATTLVFAANLQRINTFLWAAETNVPPDRSRRRDKLNNFRWDPTSGRGKKPNGILDGYDVGESYDEDLTMLELPEDD